MTIFINLRLMHLVIVSNTISEQNIIAPKLL